LQALSYSDYKTKKGKENNIMENNINAEAVQITVKRADLADALKALKFKQGKHVIPILNNAAAEVQAGAVVLKATDLESAVSYNLAAVTSAAGARFCLNIAALEAAIKGAPKKGEIQLNYTPAMQTDIHTASARASVSWPELAGGSFPVPVQPAEDFPVIPEVSTEKPEELRAFLDYKDMPALVSALAFSASAEDDRHFLNGIYFDGKEAATTDGRRLAVLPFPFTLKPRAEKEKQTSDGFILPTKSMQRAAKHCPAGDLAVYGDRAYFISPKITITTRQIQGNFPAFHQIIPKTWDRIATVDGAALLPVLLSIPDVNKGRAAVTFLFTGSGYELYNKSEKIAGFPLIEGDADFKGKALKISFNPRFVLDILEAAPGNLQMRLNNDAQPAGFFNGNGTEYLIMALRTESAAGGLAARLEELAAAAKPAESALEASAVPEAPEVPAEAPAAVLDTPAPAAEPVQEAPAAVAPAPRCTKCKWVHEADSVAGTSFQGVELCPEHAATPDLLAALAALLEVSGRNLPQGADKDGLDNCDALAQARRAISKAGGHVLEALDTSKYPAI